MVHGHTETFNTTEKASHIMLETHVNSHCNITMIGFYQLDVELMLHARTMITLHLWWCYLSADIDPCSHPKSIRFTAWRASAHHFLFCFELFWAAYAILYVCGNKLGYAKCRLCIFYLIIDFWGVYCKCKHMIMCIS